MDHCRVTRLVTNNKWKGMSIHKYVIAKAKDMVERHPTKGMTMRRAIISLQKRIEARTVKDHTMLERRDMLNSVLGIEKRS